MSNRAWEPAEDTSLLTGVMKTAGLTMPMASDD